MPTRIRFNRFDGKQLPPRSILATRPGRWGNLFNWKFVKANNDADKKRIAKNNFEKWLKTGLPLDEFMFFHTQTHNYLDERRQWILSHLHLIREAEHVACTCKLDEACHVDVLIDLAMAEAGNGN